MEMADVPLDEKYSWRLCGDAEFGLECLLQCDGKNFKLIVMNADYFWIIMAAVIVIAVVVQIIADKRKKK